MSKLSIIRILEKLSKQNKTNSLMHMTNDRKKQNKCILPNFDPMFWVLSSGVEGTPFQ